MTYLDIFTLSDVFIAGTGVVMVSMMRIYYDSYMEKKKIKRFGQSLTVYNSLVEDPQDGLLILSNDNDVIYANPEALKVLHTDRKNLDSTYLNDIDIQYDHENSRKSLLEMIHSKHSMSNGNIIINGVQKLPISLSINKVNTSAENDHNWYVVTLHDMTNLSELREASRDLLDCA